MFFKNDDKKRKDEIKLSMRDNKIRKFIRFERILKL
jgi:hypothetical protein